MTPQAYMTLCGLVRDAMEVDSDAKPLLMRVFQELTGATAGGMIPSELAENPDHIAALRRSGFLR